MGSRKKKHGNIFCGEPVRVYPYFIEAEVILRFGELTQGNLYKLSPTLLGHVSVWLAPCSFREEYQT